MAPTDDNRRLASSVLDRLLQSLPHDGGIQAWHTGADLSQLKAEVGRDLENLLNTRRRCVSLPPELAEVNKSLGVYGIPDFTGLNMSVLTERERARLEIERVIRRFEPRLKQVVVTLQDDVDPSDRRLRLRITAVLRTEPIPERVVFDSELEPSTAAVAVKAVP
jgi:type VI secretion system protein ImpF